VSTTDDRRAKPGRGRPSKGEAAVSAQITVRLTPAAYDAAFARSRQVGASVPSVVRRALDQYLDREDDD